MINIKLDSSEKCDLMRGVRRRILIMFLIALAMRLIPAAFYAHPWDVYMWLKSGELGLHDLNIYKFNKPVNYPWGFYAYPPTWLYWLIIVTVIGDIVGGLNFKIFLIKLPILFADIVAGIILYRLAEKLGFDEKKSTIITAIWLFNPITYFVSTFWGMFDSIAVVFELLAIYYILDKKYVRAGVMVGIGAAVKILPALVLLPAFIYMLKDGKKNAVKDFTAKLAVPAAAVFLVFSAPFLSTPLEYFTALFHHAQSVGGFTYWTALSAFVNLSNFWFVPVIAFIIISVIIVRRASVDEDGFLWSCTLIFVSFLATSPKVNIQYVNFLIPLILISSEFWRTKNVKRNFIFLMISGLVWLSASWFILASYDPNYLGRLYITESYGISPAHVATAIAAIFGGTRFIALLMDYFNLQKYDTAYISKWNAVVYVVVIMIGIAMIFPSPSGVVLPNDPVRIAVPESADSAFIPGSEISIDQFLQHYNVTHVVLLFSPDFINTYDGYRPQRDVTVYFRFKTQPKRWSEKDIRWLVDGLHIRKVKVLLGTYLKAEGPIYGYSVQGYSVDWVEKHPEVIGARKLLLFNSTIRLPRGEIVYAEYFSEKISEIVKDFGFDGVYLAAWDDWRVENGGAEHIIPLLEDLRSKIRGQVLVEGPDTMNYKIIKALLNEADYVVLKTAPLVNQLYYAMKDNISITRYDKDLAALLDRIPNDERGKLLFSAYIFSFVDGWVNPALELQLEIRKYSEVGFNSGYAIYYADRYAPYKVAIKS